MTPIPSLTLLLWPAGARTPQTVDEKLLLTVMTAVGVGLAVGFIRPLLKAARSLERRKKPRGHRGRRFLDRMAAGHSFLYPGGLALRGRDLRQEDMQGAFLADADFSDTDLRGVDLSDTDLEGACLNQADLRGADLTDANLVDANLVGARYDAHTRWPTGFDPARHGVRLLK